MSDELEEAKKKKLEELKQQMQEQQKTMEAEQQLDSVLKQLLEPEAKARLSRVRMVNSELYGKTVAALIQFVKMNGMQAKITDEQVKGLLEKLSEKKEITIKRK
ncbi:MAG: DNA-binding protein [Candidatus Diapherotrites archaeon]